jgi:hypothetical protein
MIKLLYENNRQYNEIVHSKPKLSTYILLRNNVFIEPFVNYYRPMSKRSRSFFAQFRFGVIPLLVEIYQNVNL